MKNRSVATDIQEHSRICFVITCLAHGGAQTQLVRLAIALRKRGWDVVVVSMLSPQAYVEDLEAQGISVYSLDIQRGMPDPRGIWRLARIVRQFSPHVVHSYMVHANILARLVRMFAPVPVLISSVRSIDERGRKGSGSLRTLLYRITDPLCDLTTQVSQAGLEKYVRIGAVPKCKIRYIPNGVDTDRFRPDLDARTRLRNALHLGADFVWLAVGRFDLPKDYPTMFRAFANVAEKYSQVRLLIAGDGPLKPSMETLARELGLREQISFLGIRRDVSDLMNAADAYVMSSAWEGMPNVLLEAHATGLPIVATDVGANRDVVQEGVSGFLVPARNPDALAAAMLRMMELPEEERRQMGLAGRQWVEDNYSLERIVDRWESLYFKLLFGQASKESWLTI